jgi:hypothetical protein
VSDAREVFRTASFRKRESKAYFLSMHPPAKSGLIKSGLIMPDREIRGAPR